MYSNSPLRFTFISINLYGTCVDMFWYNQVSQEEYEGKTTQFVLIDLFGIKSFF